MREKYIIAVALVLLVGFVSADVVSINSGGSDSFVITAGRYIEGFFFHANDLPLMFNVLLSSTYGTNTTYENLTVTYDSSDPDGDVVTNISDWRVGGDSIAVLNMPFDTRRVMGDVRDYSTYVNNGTLGGGTANYVPTWNDSCVVGGCYEFDGVNDYIEGSDMNIITNANDDKVSISLWVKTTDTADYEIILHVSQYVGIFVCSDGGFGMQSNGDNSGTCAPGTNIRDGLWHHLFVTYIEGERYLGYLDGDLVFDVVTTDTEFDTNNPLTIGKVSGMSYSYFHGYIDEVLVFDSVLSSRQVKEIHQAGLAGKSLEMIVSDETTVGETWQVAMTPNDVSDDGLTVLSNPLTIINNNPGTPLLSLVSEDGGNETDSDLICNVDIFDSEDSNLNVTLRWFKDNVQEFEYQFDNNYANGSSIDYRLLQGNLSVGDVWRCEARSYDGLGYSDSGVSNDLTIIDTTPPLITIISPEETNYSTIDILFNVSVNENASQCVYSLDYGANVSMTSINSTYFWYQDYTIGPGPHDLYVYCEDLSGNWNYSFVNFTVENDAAISIFLSDDLSWAVRWNLVTLPADDLPAIGNNGPNATGYFINISAVNTLVDIYVRADGDLSTVSLDTIGLGNETFGFSLNDSTVSNVSLLTMSTNYTLIGNDLDGNSTVFMKFYLDAPVGQAAGTYLNQLDFKAVRNGQLP
jgi:hypothetical protein